MPLVAAMLGFAAIQLMNFKKLKSVRSDCYLVIGAVAVCSILFNISSGLLIGIIIEMGRNVFFKTSIGISRQENGKIHNRPSQS